jgi:hypothetical protein
MLGLFHVCPLLSTLSPLLPASDVYFLSESMRYLEETNENVNNLLLHQLRGLQSEGRIMCAGFERINKDFFYSMPPHVLMDFVVFPPGHGSSVTDF